jgi:phospholipase C
VVYPAKKISIVVLVLENRSFDQMLGFLYADSGNVSPVTKQPFEDLTGKESNSDATGASISVSALAPQTTNVYFTPGADPGEGYVATNVQLFGEASPPAGISATNSGFATDFATTLKGIDAHRPIISGTTASDIVGIFAPELLPVLSGLARGFAVCDHWFSSTPTETFPNRAFLCAATSQGHMDDTTSKYTSQSIFGLLSAHNLAWSIYGYNSPSDAFVSTAGRPSIEMPSRRPSFGPADTKFIRKPPTLLKSSPRSRKRRSARHPGCHWRHCQRGRAAPTIADPTHPSSTRRDAL